MTLHEAIATGRRFRRKNPNWNHGELFACPTCRDHGVHKCIGGTPCAGLALANASEKAGHACVTTEGLVCNKWEVEPSEEDFAGLAEKLLNDIGIRVGQDAEVKV